MPTAIAFFVTPHGYGHAARAAAVMAALRARAPNLVVHVFTLVPRWFFRESLGAGFFHHPLLTDVGLVQKGPLEEDLPATMARLDLFYPLDAGLVDSLAARLVRLHCRAAVCDIAPLGIAAAHRAGIPAVLVENFTWDWIYRGYAAQEPRLGHFSALLAELFAAADRRIQTEPVCVPAPGALRVPPISRRPRMPRRKTREALAIRPRRPLVLVSMGGVEHRDFATRRLQELPRIEFVFLGGVRRRRREGNALFLPHRSGFYHPDLVAAADAVVGKVGYSTFAEVRRAGLPYGFVPRPAFRESPVLGRWLRERKAGLEISRAALLSGDWIARVPELLSLRRRRGPCPDGARVAAQAILRLLGAD